MTAIFDFIRQVLAVPFGFILSLLYNITNNYILAIILLTVLIKCCFLPSTVMQRKSQLKTKAHKEKIKLVEAKYSDNPEKKEEQLKKLKEQEPTQKGGLGCLSTIIHFVVMIGLFGVIYTPLSNVLNINDTAITEMQSIMAEAIEENSDGDSMIEIALMDEVENHKEELLANNVLTKEKINEIISFKERYNFFGIDLAGNPELVTFNELWIIPILVFLTSALLPLQAYLKRRKQYPEKAKFPPIEALPFLPPMMMFLFTFIFSAGVGLYWAISNLLSFIETLVLNMVFNLEKMNISIDNLEEEQEELPAPVQELAE